MKKKQIGVSLGARSELRLTKIAALYNRSLSSLAAEAIELFIEERLSEIELPKSSKRSLFTGLDKRESIHEIQKSA